MTTTPSARAAETIRVLPAIDDRATAALLDSLDDESPAVRKAAAYAIASLGSPSTEAQTALKKLLSTAR